MAGRGQRLRADGQPSPALRAAVCHRHRQSGDVPAHASELSLCGATGAGRRGPAMIRETPPHYWRKPTYPAAWWARQDPNFFPRWSPSWDRPRPDDEDPRFDRGWYQDSLVNDPVLPTQYAGMATCATTERALGEKRMVLAMIDYARTGIETYLRLCGPTRRRRWIYCHGAYGPHHFRDDWEWVFSDNERDVFSFLNCCAYTGADPYAIREELRQYRAALGRAVVADTTERTEVESALAIR